MEIEVWVVKTSTADGSIQTELGVFLYRHEAKDVCDAFTAWHSVNKTGRYAWFLKEKREVS